MPILLSIYIKANVCLFDFKNMKYRSQFRKYYDHKAQVNIYIESTH